MTKNYDKKNIKNKDKLHKNPLLTAIDKFLKEEMKKYPKTTVVNIMVDNTAENIIFIPSAKQFYGHKKPMIHDIPPGYIRVLFPQENGLNGWRWADDYEHVAIGFDKNDKAQIVKKFNSEIK